MLDLGPLLADDLFLLDSPISQQLDPHSLLNVFLVKLDNVGLSDSRLLSQLLEFLFLGREVTLSLVDVLIELELDTLLLGVRGACDLR